MEISATIIESLEQSIYDLLMAQPDMGLGEMGDCREAAKITVEEWMENNSIILI